MAWMNNYHHQHHHDHRRYLPMLSPPATPAFGWQPVPSPQQIGYPVFSPPLRPPPPPHHHHHHLAHHDDWWQVSPPRPPPRRVVSHQFYERRKPITITVRGKSVEIPRKVHEEYPWLREKLQRIGEREDAPPVWAFNKLLDFLNYGRFVAEPVPLRSTGTKKRAPRIGPFKPDSSYVHEDVAVYLLATRVGSLRHLEKYTLDRLWGREATCDDDPGLVVKMIWKDLKYRDADLMEWLRAYLKEPGNWEKLRDSRALREIIKEGGRFLASVM